MLAYTAREMASETDALLAGIDVTLIDEMLRLTPEERIELNDRMRTTVEELRRGFGAIDHAADQTGRSWR